MENNQIKHNNTLELNKVLSMLSELAILQDTKKEALNITPTINYKEVLYLNRQTADAYSMSARFAAPSFGSVVNVDSPLSRAEMGGLLTMGELLKIAEVLRICRLCVNYRENSAKEEKNSLDEIFENIKANKFLEEKIFNAIKSEDEMSDSASDALYNIRTKIKKASLNVRERLNKMIKGSSAKYLQEALITQREGRFVVPVKQEYKGEVPGLVHDTSSSGSTLFIEPMAVVEINNEIKVLKSKEKDEIERILYELTSDVSQFSTTIKESYNSLIKLDLIFAKAALAYKMRAITPKINNKGKIFLNKARHPLLNPKEVVPISLELGTKYQMLLITGPNTGGKTVTLKTIGLLTLMTQCGLMIPAEEGSEIAVFNMVLADIGDEQSIEQSLSTFSSHIKNIINILNVANENTLVLFDELCAGTDPIEGAALAKAILEDLMSKKSICAATTHYTELKSYALNCENAVNASCEFDVATLQPTYRLLIGVPGRSNAFRISQKLGLSEEIVKNAEKNVSQKDRYFDDIIAKLEKANLDALKDREAAENLKLELYKSKQSAEKKLQEIEANKEKILEKARQKAEQMLDFAKNETNRLLNELEDLKASINKENAANNVMSARSLVKKGIKHIENSNDSAQKTDDYNNYVLPRALKIGDLLMVKGFSKNAILEKIEGEKLKVVIGNIKTTVNIKDVMLVTSKKQEKTRKITKADNTFKQIKRELDLRGLLADEALIEVDRFIDSLLLTKVNEAIIIHGKGTGALREAVRKHLKTNNSVKSFRPGIFGEGENGVTVITLK